MTEHVEPGEPETRTSTDADRRHAFAALLMAMPDVGDDADFERLRLPGRSPMDKTRTMWNGHVAT